LELEGTGNFSFGYLNSLLDLTTGLLYVGNGQYYDPATGRFLTRGVNPNNTNPYVPWNLSPTGAIIGPLALLAMFYRRKKGVRGRTDPYLLVLCAAFILLGVGMACRLGGGTPAPASPSPTPTMPPASTNPQGGQGTSGTNTPTPTPSPTQPPAETDPCVNCTPTQTPTRIFIGNFNLSAYYTPVYEEQYWAGENKKAETDPSNTSAIFYGDYLYPDGTYTDDPNLALTAKEGFLSHGDGICTQGSGIINNRVIFCSTKKPETKFAWGEVRGKIDNNLGHVTAYKTVAMCGSSQLLAKGWTIYVDAPWFNAFLGNDNLSKELDITDTGNDIPALCNDPDTQYYEEGIDLYLGRGLAAAQKATEFRTNDSANRSTQYWPVYHVLK
jgi:hypothetical protein